MPLGSSGLPSVGAQAELAGMQAFRANSLAFQKEMANINKATQGLASSSSTAWGAASRAVSTATTVMAAAAAAGSAAFIGAMGAIVGQSARFEQAMTELAAVMNIPVDSTGAMGDAIIQLSKKYSLGAADIAQASADLARGGLTWQQQMEGALKATLDLTIASGGEVGLAKAAMTVAGALTAWGMSGKEAARVSNAIVAAANVSAISINDVLRSFQQTIAVGEVMNYTVEDLAVAIGLLGREFMRNSDAGTSLKQMLISLMKPSKKAADLMKEYGIGLFDAQGKALPFINVAQQLNQAFGDEAVAAGKVTEAQRMYALATIFGSDAVRAGLVLAKAGTAEYLKMANALQQTSAAEMAQKQMSALASQVKIFRNQIVAAAIDIGSQLLPALGNGIRFVRNLLNVVSSDQWKLVGRAIATAFSSEPFDHIRNLISITFGPRGNAIMQAFVNVLEAVRDSVSKVLLPAFFALFRTISGGKGPTETLTTALNNIAGGIRTFSLWVAAGLNLLTRFIGAMQQAAAGSKFFELVGNIVKILPMVAIGAVILRVVALFGLLNGTVLGVAVAFAALITAGDWVITNWDNIVKTANSLLIPAVIAASIYIGVVLYGAIVKTIAIFAAWRASLLAFYATWGTILLLTKGLALAYASDLVKGAAQAALAIGKVTLAVLAQAAAITVNLLRAIGMAIIATVAWTLRTIAALAIMRGGPAIILAFSLAFMTMQAIPGLMGTVAGAAVGLFKILLSGPAIAKGLAVALGLMSQTIGQALLAAARAAAVFAVSFAKSAVAAVRSAAIMAAAMVTTAITSAKAFLQASIMIIAQAIPNIIRGMASLVVSMGPVMLGILAVIAIVALLYTAWTQNWLGIQDVTQQVLNQIGDWITSAAQAITNAWDAAWSTFGPIVNSVFDWVARQVKAFIDWLGTVPILGDAIKGITYAFQAAGGAVQEYSKKGVEAWNNLSKGAQDFAKTAGNEIGKFIEDAKKGFPELQKTLGLTMPQMEEYNKLLEDLAKKGQMASEEQDELDKQLQKILDDMKKAAAADTEAGAPITGADQGKQSAEELARDIFAILKMIPMMNMKVAEFIAGIAIDFPERLPKMLQGLAASVPILQKMVLARRDQLYTALAIEQSDRRIARIQAELNVMQARAKVIELGYQAQILALEYQRQAVEIQINKLSDQKAAVEREMELLGRENLDLARQRAVIETAILPTKQAIERIDRAIANVEDKRTSLLLRQQEIMANMEVKNLDKQQKAVQKSLDAAWESMNVSEILRLEALNDSLTNQKDIAQERVDQIKEQQDTQQTQEELAKIGLELEKLALEDLIKAQEDELFNIGQIEAAQKQQNAVRLVDLEAQKRALEDLIYPLEQQRTLIGRQIEAIQLQMATALLQLNQEIAQKQIELAMEEQRRAELELTKMKQDEVMQDLIMQFINVMLQSGAFTAAEAAEVLTRLGLWDESIAKQVEIMASIQDVEAAAKKFTVSEGEENKKRNEYAMMQVADWGKVADSIIPAQREAQTLTDKINAIPREVTIHIKYEYEGSAPSMQYGGIVPGPIGQPVPIIAHGGERYLGVRNSSAPAVAQVSRSVTRNSNTGNSYNYNVNANYAQTQSPATVGMDMRAIIGMSKR